MNGLHFRGQPFRLAELRAELEEAKALFLDPTNEWEVIRYRLLGQIGIVYRNAKGRVKLNSVAGGHYHGLLEGKPIGGSKPVPASFGKPLTLYTDASAYVGTGAGAWGAILVDATGQEHEASGPLKGEITSSTAAEARAVANALHHFMRAGLIQGDVRIICDNEAVVSKLRTGLAKTKSEQVREALTHIRKLSRGRFNVFADWIKAHQPLAAATGDPRVAFNRRCDTLAKAHSKALHEARQKAAKEERKAKATDALNDQSRESVSHGKQPMDTNGCEVPKEKAGLPMTGNPAQARELKPHTQMELNP